MPVPLQQPAETVPETPPPRSSGLTGRALALGALLVPVLCFWNVYSDVVAQSTEPAVLSLSIGIIFVLLVLLAGNALLRRLRPRLALTSAELLTVYVMQAVSIGISGVGMTQFLCVGLGNVFHYADLQNRWAQNYQPLLPRWAFPDPDALPDFYGGQSTLFIGPHLRGWVSPVLVWSGFVLVLLVASRTRFLWWPLHPARYLLAGTFTLEWLWCSLFVGWLVKWLILRYGGLRLYRQALSFFIGLILGDYVAGALWALVGCLTGVQTYRVASI